MITPSDRKSIRRDWRLRSLALAAGLVAALLISACGSSSPKTTPTPKRIYTPKAAVTNATRFTAPYITAPVTWVGPTTKDPIVGGKHIAFIDVAPNEPTLQAINLVAHTLAAKFSWTVTTTGVSNQDFLGAVQQAIRMRPDGILIGFEDVAAAPAAYKELGEAHIPVVAFGLSPDSSNAASPGITHIVNVNYALQGQLTAAAAAILSHGNAHLGVLTYANSVEEDDTLTGIAAYFEAYGGGGVTATTYVNPAVLMDSATVGAAAVSFVRANPTMTQLFVPYDAVATDVISALKAAGLSRIGVLSAQGDPSNVAVVRSGGEQIADAVWPYRWVTYAAFDDFNRIFSKLSVPVSDGIPVREIYTGNVFSTPGYWDGGYDFEAKYHALWGIQ